MSDDTTCTTMKCDRPADGWFVCPTCAAILTQTLAEIPWMLDELDTVLTQQTKYVDTSAGKSSETPMMFNVKASDTRAALVNEIQNAARLVADANGWTLNYRTPTECAIWLERSISAIRLHPLGGQMFDDINAWFGASMWVIDRPAQRQFLGDCAVDPDGAACGGRIYGRDGKPEASCNTCGGVYQADAVRAELLEQLEDRLCTASEIARLSTYLGLVSDREQVRKRINQWSKRGQIKSHGSERFKFGEVYPRLVVDDSRRRSA